MTDNPAPAKHRMKYRGMTKKIAAKFADGLWHEEAELLAFFQTSDVELVRHQLRWVMRGKVAYMGCERQKSGSCYRYRLFEKGNLVSSGELSLKLSPLITALEAEGRKNMATMSPGTVAHLAAQLRQQLDLWAKPVRESGPLSSTGQQRSQNGANNGVSSSKFEHSYDNTRPGRETP